MHSEAKNNQEQLGAATSNLSVTVGVLPVEEEADDFDSQTIAEELTAEVREAAQTEAGYTVQDSSLESSRGADFFQILVQTLADNKEVLSMLMGSAAGAFGLLQKQRRIEEIEVTAGDKTLKLKGADRYTAQTLIDKFEETYPGTSKQITKDTPVAVTGRVSKKKRKS